jgi:hypothetical protein
MGRKKPSRLGAIPPGEVPAIKVTNTVDRSGRPWPSRAAGTGVSLLKNVGAPANTSVESRASFNVGSAAEGIGASPNAVTACRSAIKSACHMVHNCAPILLYKSQPPGNIALEAQLAAQSVISMRWQLGIIVAAIVLCRAHAGHEMDVFESGDVYDGIR